MKDHIEFGDCREILRRWAADGVKVQTCVTSPPYFSLRDYGHEGQIGLEQTPDDYVAAMVDVFRAVRDVLADDGTLWLNLGDSYARGFGGGSPGAKSATNAGSFRGRVLRKVPSGLGPKDLIGVPWRVAFALQADGWHLRQDIIWCLSGGTWLYARTQKGDMPITVKDLSRLDPSTVKLWNGEKWTQLLGMNKSARRGDELEIVLRSGERISCTPTHRFPTSVGVVDAGCLKVGDTLMSCRLPEPESVKDCAIDEDAAWLAGLYIAEGSMSGDTIQIAGHAKEHARWGRVQRIAAKFGGTATVTVDENNRSIRVYGKVLNAIIRELVSGKNAHDKGFDSVVWRYSNKFIAAMVDGYLSGDGHKNGNRWRLGFCRNYNLERDLRTACARLGYTLTLNLSNVEYNASRVPAFRGELRKERSGHHNERDRNEIVEIRKARCRHVYDLGVEDDPHLFALASGVLTHNSKPNPMPESVRDRCTKAHEYIFLLSKSPRYYFDSEAIKEPATNKPPGNTRATKGGRSFAAGDEKHRTAGNLHLIGAVEKRNRRSVWTVSTKPYNGKKALTDYVGADGKPYTASPDCPIHGHLARHRKFGTRGHGERQDPPSTGSAGTCGHHAASPASSEKSTIFHSSQASASCIHQRRMPESKPASKMDSLQTECTSGDGTPACNEYMSVCGEHRGRKTDCSPQNSSLPATCHSTGMSRTAPSLETSPPCTSSAETGYHTQSTSDQLGLFGQDPGIFESSISTGGASVRPSQDTQSGSSGRFSQSASTAYKDHSFCTCNEAIIDHFATFPPDLIEPCILAGSRPGDIVLDPFMGSGTTAMVAGQHHRHYLGCELNPEYRVLQEKRLSNF